MPRKLRSRGDNFHTVRSPRLESLKCCLDGFEINWPLIIHFLPPIPFPHILALLIWVSIHPHIKWGYSVTYKQHFLPQRAHPMFAFPLIGAFLCAMAFGWIAPSQQQPRISSQQLRTARSSSDRGLFRREDVVVVTSCSEVRWGSAVTGQVPCWDA